MLLKQVFLTRSGAVKRRDFENAHTKVFLYKIVACHPVTLAPLVTNDVPSEKRVYRLWKEKRYA